MPPLHSYTLKANQRDHTHSSCMEIPLNLPNGSRGQGCAKWCRLSHSKGKGTLVVTVYSEILSLHFKQCYVTRPGSVALESENE